jgi:hypothetical protein
MSSQPEVVTSVNSPAARPVPADRLYQEGVIAGLLGAATIAILFLVLDTLRGQPLYTPSLLGTALFRRGELLGASGSVPISAEMAFAYTWVHGLVFVVIGVIASRLLTLAEDRPNVAFGVVLLFVVFEFGFSAVALLFAEPVLRALTWPAILVGNLLAAAAMAGYLWRRHPALRIAP